MNEDNARDNGLSEYLEKNKRYSLYTNHKHGKRGITFFYKSPDGKDGKKSFSGGTDDELIERKKTYLSSIYYEDKIMRKEEQQEKGNKIAPTLMNPVQLLSENKTLLEVVEEFKPYNYNRVHYSTYEGNISNSKHILKYLGDKRIKDISYSDVLDMIDRVAEGKDGITASKKTVENVRSYFTQVIKYARKQQYVSAETVDLITTGIKIPINARKNNRNEKYAEYPQLGEALRGLEENPRYYLVTMILLLTGMREQEIFALTFSDLHRKENYIDVNKAIKKQDIKNGNRAFEIGVTKNEWSVRRVPAITEVFHYFDELERFTVSSGSRQKSREKGNNKFVIVDKNGNTVNEHTFIENYSKYLGRHAPGLVYQINMSRHCYRTHLEKLHADNRNIQIAMGHASKEVSDLYYRGDNNAYMEELYPFIEEMADNIKTAHKKARKKR